MSVEIQAKANIDQVAAWRRSSALADGLLLKLTVSGWGPQSSESPPPLWEPNTTVMVTAPSLFLAKAFPFLIRGTEHVYEANGHTTVLDLVPPETFTGEAIKEQWATVAPGSLPYVEGRLED